MSDLPFNLAQLAEGQGVVGFGSASTPREVEKARKNASKQVRAGATRVIGVRVAPEHARAM